MGKVVFRNPQVRRGGVGWVMRRWGGVGHVGVGHAVVGWGGSDKGVGHAGWGGVGHVGWDGSCRGGGGSCRGGVGWIRPG